MVTFNELRISDDRNCLIIDCEIERVDIYENMYIKSIYIEYYKNANAATMPSSKAVCIYEDVDDTKKARYKRINYPLVSATHSDMGVGSFDGGLFYVIVMCEGMMDHTIGNFPCGYDDTRRIGAILDWKAFYDRGMQYINSMFNGCNPCPDLTGLEHFAVLWNALKMAISTCDWNLVSDLWDKFLLAPSDVTSIGTITPRSSGCGCR